MTKPQKASEDKGRGNLNKRVNEMRQHAEACEKRYNDMTLPQKIEENAQRARELTAKMAKTSKKKTKRCPNPVQKRRTPSAAANVAGVNPGAPNTGDLMHRVLDGQNCAMPRPDIPCATSTNESIMPFSSSHMVPPGFDNLLDTENWTDIDQLNLSDVELPNDDVIQQLLNTTDVESLIQDQESKEGMNEGGIGEPNAQNPACLTSIGSAYDRPPHMTQQMHMSMAKQENVMTSQAAYHRQSYDSIMQQQHLQHPHPPPQPSQQPQQQPPPTQSHPPQSQHSLVPSAAAIAMPQPHVTAGNQRSMQYPHDSELNALLQRNDHPSYMNTPSSKSPAGGNPVTSMQDGKVGHINSSPHQSAQPTFSQQQKMSKTPPNVSLVVPYKTEPMSKVSLPQHHPFMQPTGPNPAAAAYDKMNYPTRNTFPGAMPPQTSSYAGVKNEPFTLPPMQSFSRDYESKPSIPSHHPNSVSNQMVNGTVASSAYRVPGMTSQGPSAAMYDPSYHQSREMYYRNEPYAMQTAPQPHLQTPGYPCIGPGPTAGPSYSSQVHAQQHGPPQHMAGMPGPVPSNVSHYSPQPHFNVAHPQYPPQATAHPSFQQPASAYGSNVYSMYNQAQVTTSDPSHAMAYRTHEPTAHMPYP